MNANWKSARSAGGDRRRRTVARIWAFVALLGLTVLFAPQAFAGCTEEVTQEPSKYHFKIEGQCPDKASAIAACVAEGAKHGYVLTSCNSGYSEEYGAYIWAGWFNWQKDVQVLPHTFVIYSYTPDQRVRPDRNLGPCDDGCFGDPINAGTGNKYETHVEFRAPGNHPLELSWTYNSSTEQGTYRTPSAAIFGRNRTHFYGRYLTHFATAGSDLINVYDPDGNAKRFTRNGDAWVSTDEGDLRDIIADGIVIGWSLVTLNGLTEYYDTAGKLTALVDIDGRRHSLVYDTLNRISKVVDDQGRELKFEYDTYSLVKKVVQPDAGVLLFNYSSEKDLAKVTYPGGSFVEYRYNEAGFAPTTTQGALTGVIDEDGVRSSSTWYENTGRAFKTELAGGVDSASATYVPTTAGTSNKSAGVLLPGGATKQFTFSVVGGRVVTTGSTHTCEGCEARVISKTRDVNGRLDLVTVNGVQTDYDYSDSGLLLQTVEAVNEPSSRRTMQADWDTQFRQPTEQRTYDASGTLLVKKTWVRNDRGQVLSTTTADVANATSRSTAMTYCEEADVGAGTCPIVGLLRAVDGPRSDVNDVTTFTYYPSDDVDCAASPTTCAYRKGDLWKVTDAMGAVTETLEYDGAGRVLSMKDLNGVVIDLEYHSRGWLSSRKVRGTDGGSEGDDQIARMEYYPTGLVKKTTLPDGSYTTYTYDTARRLTAIADGEGNSIQYTLDAAGNRTKEETLGHNGAVVRTLSRVYNALGELTAQRDAYANETILTYGANGKAETIADALGRVVDNDYDPLDRLTRTIQDVGGLNVTTQFKYDSQDNLTEVVDPKNLSTKYTYNGFGELTRLQSPDTGVTTYTYDSAGNRKTQTDARGVTVTYSYDALNRLTSVTYPDSNVSQNYTWDDIVTTCPVSEQFHKGRLSKLKNGPGTTFLRYCYDRFGNVTRKIQTVNGRVFTAIYSYTQSGQLMTLTYPGSGMVVDYVRDTLGRTTEVGVTRPGQSRQVLLTAASYYPFGPASEWVFGNGRLFRRTLNDNYQPGVVQDPTAGGLSFGYEFDAVGNLVTLRDGNQAEPPKRKFIYDALNRLTEGRNGSTEAVTEAYTYDATGNRLSVTDNGVTSTYTMAGSNHWLYNANGKSRGYDAVGNTTSIGGLERQFTYNDANRMNYVRRNAAAAQYYEYNGKGEQIRRWLSGTDNVYTVYDEAGQWLGEYDNAGTPIQQVIWLDNLPVGLVLGANTDPRPLHYIQADALGTPRRIIDPVRNVAVWNWPLTGEAFGNDAPIEDQDGDGVALVFNLRFPGQRFDAATGLNYNYFRDYDSSVGRYVESDPIGLNGGINSYRYSYAAPLTYSDEWGLAACRTIFCTMSFTQERLVNTKASYSEWRLENIHVEPVVPGPKPPTRSSGMLPFVSHFGKQDATCYIARSKYITDSYQRYTQKACLEMCTGEAECGSGLEWRTYESVLSHFDRKRQEKELADRQVLEFVPALKCLEIVRSMR